VTPYVYWKMLSSTSSCDFLGTPGYMSPEQADASGRYVTLETVSIRLALFFMFSHRMDALFRRK